MSTYDELYLRYGGDAALAFLDKSESSGVSPDEAEARLLSSAFRKRNRGVPSAQLSEKLGLDINEALKRRQEINFAKDFSPEERAGMAPPSVEQFAGEQIMPELERLRSMFPAPQRGLTQPLPSRLPAPELAAALKDRQAKLQRSQAGLPQIPELPVAAGRAPQGDIDIYGEAGARTLSDIFAALSGFNPVEAGERATQVGGYQAATEQIPSIVGAAIQDAIGGVALRGIGKSRIAKRLLTEEASGPLFSLGARRAGKLTNQEISKYGLENIISRVPSKEYLSTFGRKGVEEVAPDAMHGDPAGWQAISPELRQIFQSTTKRSGAKFPKHTTLVEPPGEAPLQQQLEGFAIPEFTTWREAERTRALAERAAQQESSQLERIFSGGFEGAAKRAEIGERDVSKLFGDIGQTSVSAATKTLRLEKQAAKSEMAQFKKAFKEGKAEEFLQRMGAEEALARAEVPSGVVPREAPLGEVTPRIPGARALTNEEILAGRKAARQPEIPSEGTLHQDFPPGTPTPEVPRTKWKEGVVKKASFKTFLNDELEAIQKIKKEAFLSPEDISLARSKAEEGYRAMVDEINYHRARKGRPAYEGELPSVKKESILEKLKKSEQGEVGYDIRKPADPDKTPIVELTPPRKYTLGEVRATVMRTLGGYNDLLRQQKSLVSRFLEADMSNADDVYWVNRIARMRADEAFKQQRPSIWRRLAEEERGSSGEMLEDLSKAAKRVGGKLPTQEALSKAQNRFLGREQVGHEAISKRLQELRDADVPASVIKVEGEKLLKDFHRKLEHHFVYNARKIFPGTGDAELLQHVRTFTGVDSATEKIIREAVNFAKVSKVLYNPAAYLNNLGGTLTGIIGHGTNPMYIPRAARELAEGTAKELKLAQSNGLFGSEFIGKSDPYGMLKELSAEQQIKAGGFSKFVGGVRKFSQRSNKTAGAVYNAAERTAKYAAYLNERALGKSPAAAVQEVGLYFANYGKLSPFFQKWRRNPVMALVANPFVANPVEAARIWRNIIVRKPAKALAMGYGFYAAYQGHLTGFSKEELAEARQLQSPRDKIFGKYSVPMPIRDSDGKIIFVDFSRIVPLFEMLSGGAWNPGKSAGENMINAIMQAGKNFAGRGFASGPEWQDLSKPSFGEAARTLYEEPSPGALGNVLSTGAINTFAPPIAQRLASMGQPRKGEEEGNVGRDVLATVGIRTLKTGDAAWERKQNYIDGELSRLGARWNAVLEDASISEETRDRRLEEIQTQKDRLLESQ